MRLNWLAEHVEKAAYVAAVGELTGNEIHYAASGKSRGARVAKSRTTLFDNPEREESSVARRVPANHPPNGLNSPLCVRRGTLVVRSTRPVESKIRTTLSSVGSH